MLLAITVPPMQRADVHEQASRGSICQLLAFADDVLRVCDSVGIKPILDGSMAVKIHTRNSSIEVRDIDFNCPEDDFSRLQQGLQEAGIFCEIQPWHVLQARRDGLKVEFGAIEFWMQGITEPFEAGELGRHTVRMVSRTALRELYQRGFDATANDPSGRENHQKIEGKLRALDAGEQ